MLIERIEGCIDDTISIDGVDAEDIEIESLRETVKSLVDSLNKETLIELISNAAYEGEWVSLGHCDQCGSNIYKYMLNI